MKNSDEKMKSEAFSIIDLFILMTFDEEYKYIARNRSGSIYVYTDKPFKDGNLWKVGQGQTSKRIEGLNEHAFNVLKWSDKDPALIPAKNEIEKIIDEKLGKMKSKKIVVRRTNNEK